MADAGENGLTLSADEEQLLADLRCLSPGEFRAARSLLRGLLAYGRAVARLTRAANRCPGFDVAAVLAADAARLRRDMTAGI